MKKRLSKSITDPITHKRIYFHAYTQKELNQKILEYKTETTTKKTFSAVSSEWIKNVNVRGSTMINYESMVKKLCEEFGKFAMDDIKISHLEKFVNNGSFQNSTNRKHLKFLRQIFKYAVANEYCQRNIADLVKVKGEMNERLPVDDHTAKIIINDCGKTWLLPYMAIMTGMRKGELIAIRYSDIDFDNDLIHIQRQYNSTTRKIDVLKTKKSTRDIPLLSPLKKALLTEQSNATSDYVFNFKGSCLTFMAFRIRLEKYCKALGINFTLHQLRHNFTTMMIDSGVPVVAAQQILGHADIQTTINIYTARTPNLMQSAKDILEKMCQNVPNDV